MLLIGVRADGNWLLSQWNLTYATGWEGICKATEEFAYADYEKFNKSLCQYLDSVEMAMCE